MRQKKAQKTLKEVQETYNAIAPEFSASRMALRHDFKQYEKYFKEGQKIVDLGCGNGRLLMLLKEKLQHFDYTGLDNSEELIKEAKKIFPNEKFVLGDQLHIPLPDSSYDILCNIRAFHHIPSKQLQFNALAEMKRVLKPDGLIIVTCWNLWNPKQIPYIFQAFIKNILSFGQTTYKDTFIPWGNGKIKRYYYAFTSHELQNLVKRSGLFLVETKKLQDFIIVAGKSQKVLHQDPKRPKILGVPFDNITNKEALEKVFQHYKKSPHENSPQEKLFIATPNPEILLEARKNQPFQKILNETSLNIPDGAGIMLAARMNKTPLKERITGTDLLQEICRHAPPGTKIFLLGAASGVAEKTKEVLEKKYPHIHVTGTYSGSPAVDEEEHIRHLINISEAQVLFVAYGAPKQEMWIAKNLPFLAHIHVVMGVGGAFDFIAGNIKRAPPWMRKLGIEWLYRVIKQPSRIGRIFNATIKFPLIFLVSKFQQGRD